MSKILFVSSRFLPSSAGGAEKLAFDYAEILSENHEITILTTTARDYITWKNEIPKGESFHQNIKILRFKVEKTRNIQKMNSILETCLTLKNIQNKGDSSLEDKFIIEQGPYCPDLLDYISANQFKYDLIILVGYLYYPIVYSIPLIKIPFVIVPTFHNEPVLNLNIYKKTYTQDLIYSFNAPEESDVFKKFTGHTPKFSRYIGTYVNLPKINLQTQDSDNLNSFKILSMGRIEPAKGYPELFDNFRNWNRNSQSKDVTLNCVGSSSNIDLKKFPEVNFLGFVSEIRKSELLVASDLLVNPSKFESFSIALMESWSYAKPVLVNVDSEVMVGHCQRSQGGLYYRDYESFSAILNYLIRNPLLRDRMGKNGRRYVELNFTKEVIRQKLNQLVSTLLD